MQPIHSIEFELTTEMAKKVEHTLVRWELRRTWPRDVPTIAGSLTIGVLIIWLGVMGWMWPAVGAVLLCVLVVFVIGAVFRRVSLARGVAMTATVALHTNDRLVRLEFDDERVRMDTEFYRGEGAWSELELVAIFPGYWLLQLTNGGQILIPDGERTPELEAFLRHKAEEVQVAVCTASG